MQEQQNQDTLINERDSLFFKNLQRGISKGIIYFDEEKQRVTYKCAENKSYSYKDPEEKVRASYFAELVLDYQYPAERIKFEYVVPRRTPNDWADIVVFDNDDCKGSPYIVVECKKDGVSDTEFNQAIEQLFGNSNSTKAKLGIVVAGTTKKAFDVAGFDADEREKNIISDIPAKYGKIPVYRFIKATENDLKEVSRDELIRALDKCHQTIWQGGKISQTVAFDEVSKLLFCKLWEEKTTKRGDAYKFQIGTHESATEVATRVKNIYNDAKKTDPQVFSEDIRLDNRIIYNVVQHLQSLAIGKIDLDTKGIAFERFMEDFFKGRNGQYFTPRDIIKFAVEVLGITHESTVLDPACGSGGFLLNAMDAIRKKAEDDYDPLQAYRIWHDFASKRLYGIEINEQIARVCKMNMIIHDDGHTHVISHDALDDFENMQRKSLDFKPNSFDFILTNPPFGAMVRSTEQTYLEKYELGRGKKNQKTEVLFIERCFEFLKSGTGKMGIILPDGILTNSSMQYVRDYIMEKFEILAVISLPSFAFSHYGAGVKSSILMLRKKDADEKQIDYPIFMAEAEKIGYDASGKKTDSDFAEIVKEYEKFKNNPNGYQGV